MISEATIEFPVLVAGTPLTATIIGEESNEVDTAFRVRFSDGYEDLFAFDEETGAVYGVESNTPGYAAALSNDLDIIIGLERRNFWTVFQHPIDGISTNIWVKEEIEENSEIAYQVFYNKHYYFELRKSANRWEVSSRSKDPDNYIDEVLAERVKFVLDSLL